ncbi:hypothetical protein RISK_005659 [Rhodopirellula islandica]|uniref:Transmembrane protein n=1 Tax=Rhodopirellula islandica TaxID=595434 RepID=A0A0J1B7P7_RHOIS|nr:hypothetical protein [Rhodopirellula islandica]KLU02593.1 hypothetical protein RISK_005659 [Rhodopirellula islandica]
MTWFSKPTDTPAPSAHEATAARPTAPAARRVNRLLRRRWISAVALGGIMLSAGPGLTGTSSAGFPEMVERVGRFCGASWGDGYHACHSSGMRPMANLPPRSYPARTGNLGDKVMGCKTCQSPSCQGTCQANSLQSSELRDGFSRLRPTMLPTADHPTFYDRFDEYARKVSFEAAAAEVGAQPVDPILDHETIGSHYPETNSPRFQLHSKHIDQFTHHGFSVLANEDPSTTSSSEPTLEKSALTSDIPVANEPLPKQQLTAEEIQRFREYQEHQRLEKKYKKYLIEPEEIEPSQTFGGPPVGSEQRRSLDERKVEELLKEKPQLLPPPSASENEKQEDSPASPSDLLDTSLEELLPPYPEEDDLLLPSDAAGPASWPTGSATDSLSHQSPSPASAHSSRNFIRQPSGEATATAAAADSTPTQRVAEVPNWRFVRQPH